MERKTKGSFRSDSLTNLSCELDWCYLASFLKDNAYKYNKMDMKYRKWIVFLLQGPKRKIDIYLKYQHQSYAVDTRECKDVFMHCGYGLSKTLVVCQIQSTFIPPLYFELFSTIL